MSIRNFLIGGALSGALAAAGAVSPALAQDRDAQLDLSKPHPIVYPRLAWTDRDEGTVIINVYVRTSGKPEQVKLVKSSGHGELDTAALQQAWNWHYLPAIRNGETVEDWAAVRVPYTMPAAAPAAQ